MLEDAPLRARGRADLARETAREACVPWHAAWAGLLVLEDMALLRVTERPAAIEMAPVRKADPRENRVFRNIMNLRGRGWQT